MPTRLSVSLSLLCKAAESRVVTLSWPYSGSMSSAQPAFGGMFRQLIELGVVEINTEPLDAEWSAKELNT